MPDNVIAEDWSDYDNKKIRGKLDSSKFACTEEWEVQYLVNKIHSVYPFYTQQKIQTAIRMVCMISKAPHPRKQFIEKVMNNLELL